MSMPSGGELILYDYLLENFTAVQLCLRLHYVNTQLDNDLFLTCIVKENLLRRKNIIETVLSEKKEQNL